MLSFGFEASLLIGSARQGEISRQLTGWAAILAVPTAIAGIYGMNFEDMPELHWAYGYFLVVAVIAVTCGYLYYRFRQAGWIWGWGSPLAWAGRFSMRCSPPRCRGAPSRVGRRSPQQSGRQRRSAR